MAEFNELAVQFLKTRRSLPYIKFDKEVSKKIKNEICVLSYLKTHGGKAHPKDLSGEFIVSSARMAVILKQFERKNYIIRTADNDDSRKTVVKLQPKGEEFLERENTQIIKYLSDYFKKFGEDDAKEFVRLYEKLMKVVLE